MAGGEKASLQTRWSGSAARRCLTRRCSRTDASVAPLPRASAAERLYRWADLNGATSPGAADTMTPADSGTAMPSRAGLLRDGGLYPIPVPLGWKLIGARGEDVAIPLVAGDPFHRILARGSLLATEQNPGQPPEVMTLRQYALPGPPSVAILSQYAALVLGTLTKQGTAPRVVGQQISNCALSNQACAKLVLERTNSGDRRTEIHYLVSDLANVNWELVYLLRRDNLGSWVPLFAEIDGPPSAHP